MTEELNKTIDESQNPEEQTAAEGEPKQAKAGALSRLNRLLSENEMKDNPAAFKLILDKVDSLQTEVDELKKYREDYHTEKTRADILDAQLKASEESINAKSAFILIGGIILGYLPNLWNSSGVFITALVIAVVLILLGFMGVISGVFSKFKIKK